MWTIASPIMNWLIEPVNHLLLAFCVGSVLYFMMLTTSFADLNAISPSGQFKISTRARFGTILFFLCLALVVIFGTHYWLDEFARIATTPLNEPLHIIL